MGPVQATLYSPQKLDVKWGFKKKIYILSKQSGFCHQQENPTICGSILCNVLHGKSYGLFVRRLDRSTCKGRIRRRIKANLDCPCGLHFPMLANGMHNRLFPSSGICGHQPTTTMQSSKQEWQTQGSGEIQGMFLSSVMKRGHTRYLILLFPPVPALLSALLQRTRAIRLCIVVSFRTWDRVRWTFGPGNLAQEDGADNEQAVLD